MRSGARFGLGVLIALALGVVSAGAQTVERSAEHFAESPAAPVWRCGNTYSHQPCGSGQTIHAQDARTPKEREQAQAQHRRLNALLDARDQERAAQAAQAQQRAAAAQREQKRQRALKQREAKKEEKAKRAAEKAHAARHKHRLQQTRERRVVIAPSPDAAP